VLTITVGTTIGVRYAAGFLRRIERLGCIHLALHLYVAEGQSGAVGNFD